MQKNSSTLSKDVYFTFLNPIEISSAWYLNLNTFTVTIEAISITRPSSHSMLCFGFVLFCFLAFISLSVLLHACLYFVTACTLSSEMRAMFQCFS